MSLLSLIHAVFYSNVLSPCASRRPVDLVPLYYRVAENKELGVASVKRVTIGKVLPAELFGSESGCPANVLVDSADLLLGLVVAENRLWRMNTCA